MVLENEVIDGDDYWRGMWSGTTDSDSKHI